MNKDTWFTSFVCVAILQGFEARKSQDTEIKACQDNTQELRNWLVAKFPPEKWQQMDALQRVILWGRQLQEEIKDIPPGDRSIVSFKLSDLEDHYGACVPKWLGGPIKTNAQLSNISFLYRNLADEARYLDYEGSQDFFIMGQPYFSDFPDGLSHYLDTIIQPKISRLQEAK